MSQLPYDPNVLKENIRKWAKALGLDVGFTHPNIPIEDQARLDDWLKSGYHASLHFMTEHQSLRKDPTQLHPNTHTIISARLSYWSENDQASARLNDSSIGYISRYALGRDYHKVMRSRLKQLCLRIESDIGAFTWRPFSDSAPIMEHAIARQSGLGFIGKHTLLIHPKAGSTFFLGEILCDLRLPADAPTEKCGCGPCTRCLTDCPTQAIVAPFTVDARRCISYLTIEHKGSIDVALRPLMGNRIYGCDDCQLVCPWHKFSQSSPIDDSKTRHQLDQQPLLTLWSWDEAAFLTKTEGSAIRRIGFEQWRRNIAIALGNAAYDVKIIQALEQALPNASDLLAEHIRWALTHQKL